MFGFVGDSRVTSTITDGRMSQLYNIMSGGKPVGSVKMIDPLDNKCYEPLERTYRFRGIIDPCTVGSFLYDMKPTQRILENVFSHE